jgi:plasmid maintenance system antidote protein VapI
MAQDPRTELGRILRSEGRTQRWLAAQIGIDESRVSHFVHGHRVPEDLRVRIAEALGRKVADVFPPSEGYAEVAAA